MRVFSLSVIILVFLGVMPIHAAWPNNFCQNALNNNINERILNKAKQATRKLKQNTFNYIKKVTDTRGLRLFLKPVESQEELIANGFLSPKIHDKNRKGFISTLLSIFTYIPEKISSILGKSISGNQNLNFTPLAGFYHNLVRLPVAKLTESILYEKLEPSFLTNFVASLVLALHINLALDEKTIDHMRFEVESNKSVYLQNIEYDIRYEKIKRNLKAGTVSEEQAVEKAYAISLVFNQYYTIKSKEKLPPSLEDELELLDSYLFSHLNNIILRGVTPTEGFYVPESSVGNLNENQILQLFKNSHFKYMMYQAVFELVKDTDLGQKLKLMEYELGSNNINWLTKSTLNTRLQELELEGKISSEQRISALQLYVEWYVKFLDWSVLGVTRLSVDENGEFTNIPLTLDEIQFEILNLFVFEN